MYEGCVPCRKIVQQYVYGRINELESLQEASLQIYTPNTRFWWRLASLECALRLLTASLLSPCSTSTTCGLQHALACLLADCMQRRIQEGLLLHGCRNMAWQSRSSPYW